MCCDEVGELADAIGINLSEAVVFGAGGAADGDDIRTERQGAGERFAAERAGECDEQAVGVGLLNDGADVRVREPVEQAAGVFGEGVDEDSGGAGADGPVEDFARRRGEGAGGVGIGGGDRANGRVLGEALGEELRASRAGGLERPSLA